MYEILRNGISLGITENEPTQEYLDEMLCDSYREYSESTESKKNRIKLALISSPDLSTIDFDWVSFSDIEIGEIIRSRVFGWNPHAESALQAKTSAYLLSALAGNPNDELLASIQDKQEKINEIRLKFGLTII